jgi:hypothetical protein
MDNQKANNSHLGYDLEKLIPELTQWRHGRGIDVVVWIGAVGNFEHGIGYGRMFWEEYVEYDDCILSANFDEDSYWGFLRQFDNNKEAVERVMNHVHVSDCFPSQKRTTDQVIYFGRLLKEIWQAKLERDFPTRTVLVEFYEEVDYEITFFQPRGLKMKDPVK